MEQNIVSMEGPGVERPGAGLRLRLG